MTLAIAIGACLVAAAMSAVLVRLTLAHRALKERFRPVVDLDAEMRKVQAAIAAEKAEAARTLDALGLERKRVQEALAADAASAARTRAELEALEEETVLREHGFYKPHYRFESSQKYEDRLDAIREQQKRMIKDKTAATCAVAWEVHGSKAEGRKHTQQYLKLMLRAFNGECDAAIAKVTYKNVRVMEERIKKAAEAINALASVQQSSIQPAYVQRKLEELRLVHEYEEKIQEEKEEQKRIREQMREEEAAMRDLERQKVAVEREERRYAEALDRARVEVGRAEGAKQQKLQDQIAELERRLAEVMEKERAIAQAQLTKAGHVYVISNIGSFGEEVFKIGMTRRLVPQDRIDELGDASVPFEFDVHAIISASDAPALEATLHKAFHTRRMNRVNERKEFFRVSLDEIAAAVRKHHGEVEFTRLAEAAEYRRTMALDAQERRAGPKVGATAIVAA